MWFAALGNYRENPWFVNFAVKLLEGSPEVRGLLEADPFGGEASALRSGRCCTITGLRTRRSGGKRGIGGSREAKGQYLPPVGLG